MMGLPSVAVDLDGVLADTITSCCRIINAKHSTSLRPTSFVNWKAWEIAEITMDEFFRTLDEAWLDWQTIPPTENELADKVGRLQNFSKVDIVTARSPQTVASAKSWLHAQRIRFNSFVRTNSGMDKINLDYDVFIDDSPDVMAALSLRPNRHGIIYSQPWNKAVPVNRGIYRVESWNEIPEIVLGILSAEQSK